MRVHIGSDHAGFEVKNRLIESLRSDGIQVVDHGPHVYDALDDFPPFCIRTAEAVAMDEGSLGVVLGGSGNGEQIAANKVAGIRAALAWSVETARLAREHNNAHVVSVGARMHSFDEVHQLVEVFIRTPYTNEDRHNRRLQMILDYEDTGEVSVAGGG
ncbi:MAG: ribose-5-phosphate isomerase [Jiangellales bacterium]|jgi:ribose 5-phosphate isomerase B